VDPVLANSAIGFEKRFLFIVESRLVSEITSLCLLAFSRGEAAGFLLIIERDAPFLNTSSTTFGFTPWR
jgi:hypothetical protein